MKTPPLYPIAEVPSTHALAELSHTTPYFPILPHIKKICMESSYKYALTYR